MPSSPYTVPLYNRVFRAIFRPIFRALFHILSHVRITGLENVPESGAYLIVINHVSLYEAPFLLAFWPVAPEAAGAADIWSRTGQSFLASMYGGIPVHRGQYDRKLLDTMLNVLKSGYPLAIAPEGGRSHTPGMRRALPGAAYLIDRAKVPIVPVGIAGATDDFLERGLLGKRPTIEMHIGPAVNLPSLEGKGQARREARQRQADLIMTNIAALLPLNYRGVYTDEFADYDTDQSNYSETDQ